MDNKLYSQRRLCCIWRSISDGADGRASSHSFSIYEALGVSHSSHLLISLLLSIGVRVIGCFTHVRVELAEGKGQATRLSVSCSKAIHQLLSDTKKATAALSRHIVKSHPGLPV